MFFKISSVRRILNIELSMFFTITRLYRISKMIMHGTMDSSQNVKQAAKSRLQREEAG